MSNTAVLSDKTKKRFSKQKIKEYMPAYLMMLPNFIMFGVFVLYPLLWALRFMFYEYDGISQPIFVGIDNFIRAITRDPVWWKSVGNTLLFAFGKLILEIPIAIIFAVLLNGSLRGKSLFRGIFFLPTVTSAAVMSLVFSFMFSPYNGFVNGYLVRLGFIDANVNWLSIPSTAMIVCILTSVWQVFGQNMLLVMSGLSNISNEIYESAQIDGANKIQAIVDNKGNIITSNNIENPDIFKKAISDILLKGKNKQIQQYIGTHKMLITSKEISVNNWNIISFIPVSKLTEQTTTLRQFSILIIFVCLLLSSVMMIFVVNVITAPISKMARTMKKVKEGDLTVQYAVHGNDEIGIMGNAFNDMVQSINTLIKEVQYEREVSTTAELRTLQEQINAHFIYNTLDSIYWLSKKGDSEKAAKMTSSFAQFLRVGLNKGAEYTTFKNECEHISNYMIIENIRYENRFDYEIFIDESIENYDIIKLITQPLVENAILHGVYDLDEKGKIDIQFKDEDDFVVIAVKDDGKGMDAKAIMQKIKDNTINKNKNVESFALFNVYYRIKVKYKELANMEINSEIGKGTEVRLVFDKQIWNSLREENK